jgi:hypothetical protein
MIDPNNTSGSNTSGATTTSGGGSFWENLSLEGLGSLIGAVAGGTGLLGGGSQQKTGYQGQIPNLTAVRDQIPYGQVESEGRRPGGAGRRYFTDTVYAKSAPGAGLPSLEQAQQQVADQREAILAKQPYQAPSYVESGATEQAASGQSSVVDLIRELMERYAAANTAQSSTTPTAPTSPNKGITTGIDLGGLTLGGSPAGGLPEPFGYASPKYNFQTGQYETGAPVWLGAGNTPDADSLAALLSFQSRYSPGMTTPSYQTREQSAIPKGDPRYSQTLRLAQGGIASLPQTKGYYLGGATDGMADEVPANIDGKQPAALSDGEFVVPADVVSHLGNGNSNSGARQLYQMMERIRKARTGNAKQGKQINPKNMLPG